MDFKLIMMKEEHEWLVTIHCASHHLELALKDAVKRLSLFSYIDIFYKDLLSFLKTLENSRQSLGRLQKHLASPTTHCGRFMAPILKPEKKRFGKPSPQLACIHKCILTIHFISKKGCTDETRANHLATSAFPIRQSRIV